MSYVTWLRSLSEKGGKGTVDNIDARCLGRIADEIENLQTDLRGAKALHESAVTAWIQASKDRDEARKQLVKRTAALEFIRDGYDNQDINHVDFRVGAYKAALDALLTDDLVKP